MYSSYTAAQIARTYELADLHQVNLLGSVTWAFEFEGQPYFAGFRDLATNGIDKPVLNVFRMLGRMAGDRLAVQSTSAAPLESIRDSGVRDKADVNALASRKGRDVAVLVWNYHDDDVEASPAEVTLTIEGIESGRPTLTHSRVDRDHSNAYEAWKKMGSPQPPSSEQRTALEFMGKLQVLKAPEQVHVEEGRLTLTFALPRQGVSLVELKY
jgi:xylan 1,4-beta-xylosidase